MSPIVCFQLEELAISSPSTKQPPGKRRNAGLRALIASARSLRKKRPFQVFSGMSEIMSRNATPSPESVSFSLPLASDLVGTSSREYSLHPLSWFEGLGWFDLS